MSGCSALAANHPLATSGGYMSRVGTEMIFVQLHQKGSSVTGKTTLSAILGTPAKVYSQSALTSGTIHANNIQIVIANPAGGTPQAFSGTSSSSVLTIHTAQGNQPSQTMHLSHVSLTEYQSTLANLRSNANKLNAKTAAANNAARAHLAALPPAQEVQQAAKAVRTDMSNAQLSALHVGYDTKQAASPISTEAIALAQAQTSLAALRGVPSHTKASIVCADAKATIVSASQTAFEAQQVQYAFAGLNADAPQALLYQSQLTSDAQVLQQALTRDPSLTATAPTQSQVALASAKVSTAISAAQSIVKSDIATANQEEMTAYQIAVNAARQSHCVNAPATFPHVSFSLNAAP